MAIASFSFSAGGNSGPITPPPTANQWIRVIGYRASGVSGGNSNQITWAYQPIGGGSVTPIDGPHNLGDPAQGAAPLVVESQGEEPVFDLPVGMNLILQTKNATEVDGSVTYFLKQNL